MADFMSTTGTAVWRHSWPGEASMPVLFGNRPTAKAPLCEPGTWYPEALDAARTRVIEAALRMGNAGNRSQYERAYAELAEATTALDALTQEAPDA